MPEIAQHIIVTLVAIWAAYLVVTRIFSLVGPGDRGGTCDSCPTGQRRAGTADVPGAAKPLTLIREQPPAARTRPSS